jgi:hypothetical protein
MSIDLNALRRHFAGLSDEALAEIDRSELVEAARQCYDQELASRGPAAQPEPRPERAVAAAEDGEPLEPDAAEGEPDWLEDAVGAYAYHVRAHRGGSSLADTAVAAEACAVLGAAGIPSRAILREAPEPTEPSPYYEVMVPGVLAQHATSILDRDLFNPVEEQSWKSHLAELSDDDLRLLDPEIFCAGMLDRAARLTRAYRDELARRARR